VMTPAWLSEIVPAATLMLPASPDVAVLDCEDIPVTKVELAKVPGSIVKAPVTVTEIVPAWPAEDVFVVMAALPSRMVRDPALTETEPASPVVPAATEAMPVRVFEFGPSISSVPAMLTETSPADPDSELLAAI